MDELVPNPDKTTRFTLLPPRAREQFIVSGSDDQRDRNERST